MAEERPRPGQRPGGRRPVRLAGHRRREATGPGGSPEPAAAPGQPAAEDFPVAGQPTQPEHPPTAEQSPEAGVPAAGQPSGTPEAGAEGEPPVPPAPLSALRIALAGVALLVVALLAVLVVARISSVRHGDRLSAARSAALAAATRAGKPLLSYDYRTLDQQLQSTDPLLTPSYRKKYDATINEVVRSIAVPNKAVLSADVRLVGVREATTSSATVLLFADLSSTNKQRPDTRVDHTPLVMCMVKRGPAWLVDDVETRLGFVCGQAPGAAGTPSGAGSATGGPAGSTPASTPAASTPAASSPAASSPAGSAPAASAPAGGTAPTASGQASTSGRP